MKKEESIIMTDTVRVRVMTLAPGEETPRHHHTQVTDTMVCLTGAITVEEESPGETRALRPGDRWSVPVGRVHRVKNDRAGEPSEYLLVQGVGVYDFITG